MARRRGRVRRSLARQIGKTKQTVGSLIGNAIQIIGVGHGLIRAVADRLEAGGRWDRLPHDMVFYYSGFNTDNGNLITDQTIQSASIILVSWLVGKGIKYVSKH